MKIRYGVLIVVFFLQHVLLGSVLLQVDPLESHISFSSRALGIHQVSAQFLGFGGRVFLKSLDTIDRIEGVVDTNSIFTDNTIRDRDLRQRNFFHTAKYPYIQFVADGPILVNSKTLKGKLTIKGVTQEVEIPVKFQFLKNKMDQQVVLSAVTQGYRLRRSDYGMDAFSWLISDYVEININIIFRSYLQ